MEKNSGCYDFMPRKSNTDAKRMYSALRMFINNYRVGQKELQCVFVHLEKKKRTTEY